MSLRNRSPGFGSSLNREINNLSSMDRLASFRVWKRLHAPEHIIQDPYDPYHLIYNHVDPNYPKSQMARRMDRKVIKLEVAFGPDRTPIIVKRDEDLIVSDLQAEIARAYRIPIEEQVIFHKSTNICDFPSEKLEALGIENNHQIRLTRDSELPSRSARNIQPYFGANNAMQGDYNSQGALDPVSYLKEISPQRVPDPTPYQIDMYNKNAARMGQPNDVLKLYAALGSEREYILVHGVKPITIADLKREIFRIWRMPPEQQCIVFKGYNLHEYLDSAPLETFGLENNSPISVWPKGGSTQQTDVRLPRGASPPPTKIDAVFSPRIAAPPGALNNQRFSNESSEVLKLEIQHGSDRIPLILKAQNKYLTVLDLQNELEKVTAVPIDEQRVYFRSHELHLHPHKSVKEVGLENNNTVKLVGEPSKVRYSNYFGRLNPNIPNSVDQQFWGNPEFQRQNYQPQFHQNQQQQLQQQQQQQQQQQYQQQNYSPQNQQYSQSQAFASMMPSNNRANQSQVFGQAPSSNRF